MTGEPGVRSPSVRWGQGSRIERVERHGLLGDWRTGGTAAVSTGVGKVLLITFWQSGVSRSLLILWQRLSLTMSSPDQHEFGVLSLRGALELRCWWYTLCRGGVLNAVFGFHGYP